MTFQSDTDPELVPEFVPTEERFYAVVDTKEFRKLVVRVSAVSKDSGIIEGTDLLKIRSVAPSTGVSGFLEVSASDGGNYFSSRFFQSKTKTDEDIYVPAKKFSDVMKLAQGDLTTLKCVGFKLSVVSGNSKWEIALPPKSRIRDLPDEEFSYVSVPTKKLDEYFRSTLRAAATGFARASMKQIKLGEGNFMSSDGQRIHRIAAPEFNELENVSVPVESAKFFIALLGVSDKEQEVAIGVSDSLIKLRAGEDEITTVRTTLPFPDVEKAFISQSVMNDTALIVDTKMLAEAVSSVKVFATDALSSVSLVTIKDSKGDFSLLISSEDEIGNASKSVIPCTLTGKNQVNLKLSYKYVIDVLDSLVSDMVSIRVGKNTKTSRTTAFFEDIDHEFVAVLSQTIKE